MKYLFGRIHFTEARVQTQVLRTILRVWLSSEPLILNPNGRRVGLNSLCQNVERLLKGDAAAAAADPIFVERGEEEEEAREELFFKFD